MNIESRVDAAKKIRTFTIEGDLDAHSANTLKDEIGDETEAEGWTYIIDMQKVNCLDSSGLSILVYLKKELHRCRGTFKIINLSDSLLKVFKLTKLDGYFEL